AALARRSHDRGERARRLPPLQPAARVAARRRLCARAARRRRRRGPPGAACRARAAVALGAAQPPRRGRPPAPPAALIAVFADPHAHAQALDAVIAAADAAGAEALWSLGDMVGGGPDPDVVVARTRERCAVALLGNHDYGATGSAEPTRFGEPGSPAARSIELARERLDADAIAWMRSLRPAARRGHVQCWHGGPHNPVREYVGKSNAAACLETQKGWLGLVGHTHAPAAFLQTPRGARSVPVRAGEP